MEASSPTVTHHPPGDTAHDLHAGDFLLTGVRSQSLISWAIKVGSRLRRFSAPFRRFSHAALVIAEDGELAEALGRGVTRSPLSKYEPFDYVIVRTGVDDHDRAQILSYADSVLKERTKYGFVTIAGLALYCFTGAQLCIQRAGTAICSGFVSDALTRAGYIWPRPPFSMMPADLARYFDVTATPGS